MYEYVLFKQYSHATRGIHGMFCKGASGYNEDESIATLLCLPYGGRWAALTKPLTCLPPHVNNLDILALTSLYSLAAWCGVRARHLDRAPPVDDFHARDAHEPALDGDQVPCQALLRSGEQDRHAAMAEPGDDEGVCRVWLELHRHRRGACRVPVTDCQV